MACGDVIVIGCGLVGAAAARRLADGGRRVLVVEQGRVVSSPPGSHLRNDAPLRDAPDDHFATIDVHLDYLDPDAPPAGLPGAFTTSIHGGMGVLWRSNCPRAVRGVDRPDVLDDDEWSSSYERAEQYLGVRDDQFDDSLRGRSIAERLRGPLAAQGRETVRLPLSGARTGPHHIDYVGPAQVLEPVAEHIEVMAGAVDAVELSGDRATGVRVDGALQRADHVVVAAGAIATPVLLWRSGLTPPALGRHLSYHPVLIGQVVLEETLCATGSAPDPLPRLGIPPTPERPWFVMVLRDTNPLPVDPSDHDVPPNRLVEIQAFVPVDPHPDNAMTLDQGGEIRFDVRLRDADRRRREAIERDVHELAARLGRFRVGSHPQWAPLGTPHLIGSCRMGATDDGTSVADIDGRVWGTENLFLATNGVIPTRLAVNPTLTAAALAIRTADRVAAQPSAG